MDYTSQLKSTFEKLPFINIKELSIIAGMDRVNFDKYCKGKLTVSESNYEKIMATLAKAKAMMP